jgi:hypothetical protein
VPSSEAGGHTQYQPKSGIFKSAVLNHFHIGADITHSLAKSNNMKLHKDPINIRFSCL